MKQKLESPMNDIGKVVEEMLAFECGCLSANSIHARIESWAKQISRLQSSGNVCQGLTDEQFANLYMAMDNGWASSPDETAHSDIAKAARAYLAALPKGDGWMPIESAHWNRCFQ